MACTRGQCASCYTSSNTSVRAGKITWKQLEEEGKASPPVRKGNNSNTWRGYNKIQGKAG